MHGGAVLRLGHTCYLDAEADLDGRMAQRSFEQYRLEHVLRTGADPRRRDLLDLSPQLGIVGHEDATEFLARDPRDPAETKRELRRQRGADNLLVDSPLPEQLHRARVEVVPPRMVEVLGRFSNRSVGCSRVRVATLR